MTDLFDAQGSPMTGDAGSVALYDRAIDRSVCGSTRMRPDAAGKLAGALDPVPMAHVLTAYPT